MPSAHATRIQDPLRRGERPYRDFLEGRRQGVEAIGNLDSFRAFTKALTVDAQRALAKWHTGQNGYSSSAPYQVLDFFCGSGGMSAGFASLGRVLPSFEVVGGCDIDPDAALSFESNYASRCLLQDLAEVVPDRRSVKTLLKNFPRYDTKRPLILIGCAPCQGFTSHRKKNWSRNDDRNGLVEVFANFAAVVKPECIVMENVPELLSHKYWEHFEAAKHTLERAGYTVKAAIYNAASFGVPQERFRALVIGMRKEFILPGALLTPSDFQTVRDAIGGLPPVSPGEYHPNDKLHRCAFHRENTMQTIRAVPKDGGSRPHGVGPKCLDKIKGFSDVYGRLRWDAPAITITHYARNPASGRYTHPEQDRGLSMREAALLQSFPSGYCFEGTFDSVFKQIGEAVPPKFSCAIASHVFTELISAEPSEAELHSGIQPITSSVSSSYSSVIAGLKVSRRKK